MLGIHAYMHSYIYKIAEDKACKFGDVSQVKGLPRPETHRTIRPKLLQNPKP